MRHGGRPTLVPRGKQRTYYVSLDVADAFKDAMGGNPSKYINGVMMLMLAAPKSMREDLIWIGRLPIAQGKAAIRQRLPEWLEEMKAVRHVAALPGKARTRVIQLDRSKTSTRSR